MNSNIGLTYNELKSKWLLGLIFVFYSLLPGIYKILDQQALLLLNIPLLLFLAIRGKEHFFKIDLLFWFYLLYILFQTFLWLILGVANRLSLMMGFYLSVIPMLGYFFSRKIAFKDFADIIMLVAFLHGVIGILLYPFFAFHIFPERMVNALSDGVMYGRMSSVSGSLGFGSMMMAASICAYYFKKYGLFIFFLLCLIFSMQRSAWVALFFAIALYNYYLLCYFKTVSFFRNLVLYTLLGGVVIYFLSIGSDFDFLLAKFNDLGSAIEERDKLWLAGIHNFCNYPLGTGVGQVGQVARFESTAFSMVPDGDYFRILSEFGVMAFLFYVFWGGLFLFFIIKCRNFGKEEMCVIAVLAGFSIQMIGSNITEFYYNNYIYWVIMGYFFLILQSKIKMHIS